MLASLVPFFREGRRGRIPRCAGEDGSELALEFDGPLEPDPTQEHGLQNLLVHVNPVLAIEVAPHLHGHGSRSPGLRLKACDFHVDHVGYFSEHGLVATRLLERLPFLVGQQVRCQERLDGILQVVDSETRVGQKLRAEHTDIFPESACCLDSSCSLVVVLEFSVCVNEDEVEDDLRLSIALQKR